MSVDDPSDGGGGSRRTNLNNSVNTDTGGNSAVSTKLSELPTPESRVSEFADEFPQRAAQPLATGDGISLRREFVHTDWVSWHSEGPRERDDAVSGQDLRTRTPVSWSEAVKRTLENHLDTLQTKINLVRGKPSDADYAEHSLPAETRWFASYQKRYFAQLKAWLREMTGGQRPSGGSCEGQYENPRIALLTLSASSTPDGERVGPVEHDKVRRSSWSGSGGCYDTLRNTMRSLGHEWQYDRRSEPHTGKRGTQGINQCYGHDHVILVVDGDVSPADLRPVIEKHVEKCEWAGPAAHDLDKDWTEAPQFHECDCEKGCNDCIGTVSIRDPDELEDVAAYVADYCAIEPVDLLERDIQYIAWAAAVNAANTKTISRSDGAKRAATADQCKQKYESESCDQSVDHGESVIRSTSRGAKIECAKCGSPHGIDQDQTLTAARTSSGIAADGGVDRAGDMLDKWPSARALATVGESLSRGKKRELLLRYQEAHDLDDEELYRPGVLGELGLSPYDREIVDEIVAGVDPDDAVSASRPPEWQIESIEVAGEKYPASSGNGIDLVETVDPIDRIISGSRLDDPRADRTYWETPSGTCVWGARSAAAQLLQQSITHPEVIDDSLAAKQGALAD
ncbi:hypothetical protein EGH22_10630 [Halomicroarcula sp. F28]|uniref:hypothetical protein n=1 Tax=Haloarcula salinisoli TaxID=2487746 RepID=UPI001C730B4C|nr:hypothetical protein [Halomicroarcula salinisoli]MBX0286784.1 hypothetical protein [Halomicroarcula salinisoli]